MNNDSPGKPSNELWEDFANAIIIRAAFDYRAARRKLYQNPYSHEALSRLKEIERFFHSTWYETLTTVDGNYILNRLRSESPRTSKTKYPLPDDWEE